MKDLFWILKLVLNMSFKMIDTFYTETQSILDY